MLTRHHHVCLSFMLAALVVPSTQLQAARVSGTVTYRERIALPPSAEINVQLQDVSRADPPAIVIAEQSITANGQQVPFAWELIYDPATIRPSNSYAVRATIRDNGRLLFTSTQAYLVLTQGRPSVVDIVVQRVDGGTSDGGQNDASDPPSQLPNTGAAPAQSIALLGLLAMLGGAALRAAASRRSHETCPRG